MTVETFTALLETGLSRTPFQVFTIELMNGKRFEIDHPRSVVYRDGFAVFIAPGRIPVFFDHDAVANIFVAPSHAMD